MSKALKFKFPFKPQVLPKGHTIFIKSSYFCPQSSTQQPAMPHCNEVKEDKVLVEREFLPDEDGNVRALVKQTCKGCKTVHTFDTTSSPKATIEPPDSKCPHIKRECWDYYCQLNLATVSNDQIPRQ
jgi:hypothetical protein